MKKIWHAANSVLVFIPYGTVTFLTCSEPTWHARDLCHQKVWLHMFGTFWYPQVSNLYTYTNNPPVRNCHFHFRCSERQAGNAQVKSPYFFCFRPQGPLKGGSTGAVVLTQDTTQNPSMDLIQLFLDSKHMAGKAPKKSEKWSCSGEIIYRKTVRNMRRNDYEWRV